MRPPIVSEKKIVQVSLANVAGNTLLSTTFCEGVQVGNVNLVSEVPTGSVVKRVYIEMWIRSEDTTATTGIVTLEKRIGSMATMTTTESAALGNYDNKKNVLQTFMGLVGDQDQYATPALKGWYNIPKGKQRIGLADKLVINVHSNTTVGMNICGFVIYKNYT